MHLTMTAQASPRSEMGNLEKHASGAGGRMPRIADGLRIWQTDSQGYSGGD